MESHFFEQRRHFISGHDIRRAYVKEILQSTESADP